MDLPNRKQNRLKNFDYGQNGMYFITICVKDRKRILSNITVGTSVLDCPKIKLSKYGMIADKHINRLNNFYDDISVEKYVIMPDHIHLILWVKYGQSRTPVPTSETIIDNKNSTVAKFIGTFKRFSNKEYGENIWQSRYYDHIIRNQHDYDETWEYIDNNPINWILKHKKQNQINI